MTTTTSTTLTAQLVRHGRMPWSEARTILAGTRCYRADLEGIHLGPHSELPTTPPAATHLWAWRSDELFRIRFDRQDALVASLRLGETARPGTPHPVTAQPVTVRVSAGLPWGEEREEVGRLPQGVYDARFDLLEISGPQPVTFIREQPRHTTGAAR